jgi:hypothetical protein
MPHPQDTAIAHVATLAGGGPADPSWRVTLHFHPDRLVAGTPGRAHLGPDHVLLSR